MNAVRTLLIVIILFIAAFLVYIYSGTYNIAATAPHGELAEWIFNTTKKYSVKKHAENIVRPALESDELVKTGFNDYDSMCSGCHGTPGLKPAEGFNPSPPALAEKTHELTPSEIFWIIKNGIKMTGMPEFGSTHSDQELWGIVAFIERLQDISPEEYDIMKRESGNIQHQHGHDHRQTGGVETAHRHGSEHPDERQERETHIHRDGLGNEH